MVLVLATEDIIDDHDELRLVRRAGYKKRPGARSVPPNGRTPLSRETKYQEAKREAVVGPKPSLERAKSLPNRPNPVVSNVAEKEKQAGQALKKLRSAQDATRPGTDAQINIWNDVMHGQASPAESYRALKLIGGEKKAVEPLFQNLANTYASAGKASMDAGLAHRAMRNKLKAGFAVAAGQLAKDEARLINNAMTGRLLPAVALERLVASGGRLDSDFNNRMQTAAQARAESGERTEAVRRGRARIDDLKRNGGHDSESEGYNSERSNVL